MVRVRARAGSWETQIPDLEVQFSLIAITLGWALMTGSLIFSDVWSINFIKLLNVQIGYDIRKD